ncbi:MAG: hypothetical protein E6J06_06410 [Chloroflexi bacterium]|nr:MAG: hypothetical protein E6J06_06410 [Chloroflexota bacterium]
MDDNLTALEGRAASSAARYGRLAAIGLVVVAAGGAAYFIYRRMRRPTLKDRLDGLSVEKLRSLAEELSGRVKDELPSVTVTVNEKTEREPGTIESLLRKLAPALVGTASTALLDRVSRPAGETDGPYSPPQAD